MERPIVENSTLWVKALRGHVTDGAVTASLRGEWSRCYAPVAKSGEENRGEDRFLTGGRPRCKRERPENRLPPDFVCVFGVSCAGARSANATLPSVKRQCGKTRHGRYPRLES